MRRRSFLLHAAALASIAVVAMPAARADELDESLGEITKARAGLKTLVGEFTQERKIGLLASTVKSTGELTMVRPDKLRWELKAPDAITYWITPEGLAFATPSGGASVGKAAAGKFGAVLSDLMIFMGGDLTKLKDRYELAVKKTTDGITLTAKPKAEDVAKNVKSIEMTAGADLWSVKKIVIAEKSGDSSVITFTKLSKDVKVDAAKMTPPKA